MPEPDAPPALPEDRPDPARPIVLVTNPSAGGGRGGRAAEAARATLTAAGVAARVVETAGAGEARAAAAAAAREGASVVAAVGGDGTLHEVGEGVLGARLAAPPPLGLVPVGTGNDYAKMLGLHGVAPEDAARALLAGPARRVDALRLEGCAGGPEHALNNVGLAYLAEATAARDRVRWLGAASYLVGGVAALVAHRPALLEVTVDGVAITGRFLFVHVGVGAWCGGGIRFAPARARLDEGALDVVVALERGRLEALRDWGRLRVGAQRDDVAFLRGRRVRVRGPHGLRLHADGELRAAPLGVLELTLLPGALRVIHAR